MKRIGFLPREHGLKFTSDWVSRHVRTWRRHLRCMQGKPHLRMLEIGSWEGRSTCWFLRNILSHPTARVTCVDTFAGAPIELAHHKHLRDATPTIEAFFDHNVRFLGARRRVRKMKGRSREILRLLPLRHFDLVYIDGSHLATDVLLDAALSWDLLKVGGIMIFDDYRWKCAGNRRNPLLTPRPAIDAFRSLFVDSLRVLSTGTQVIVRKVAA